MGLVDIIAKAPQVKVALDDYKREIARSLEKAIALQQIPAPTFQEAQRAAYVRGQFEHLGLEDVSQDDLNNVFGRISGIGQGLPVVVSAHLDTVFSLDTDLSIRWTRQPANDAELVYGPGLADNAMGVAGLMLLAESVKRFDLRHDSDVWLVANVAEEGLGDLKGMKAVVERFGRTTAYIVVEGGSFGHIFHEGIGVQRFEIGVTTAGGHSWGDFGSPSAIHVLGTLINSLNNLPLPSSPKTTYNVGVVAGGTTINTIAASAHCLLDLRSTDANGLGWLVSEVEGLVDRFDQEGGVTVTMTQIGRRPSGSLPRSHPLVGHAADALRYVGCQRIEYLAGSTDANIPLSLGYPAVCVGLATSGNTHRTNEYLDTMELSSGLGQLLLLTLAAAGFKS